MNDQVEYLYYRQLFDIFKAYTTPKLTRVLDANNIKYMLDGKGKPLAYRDAVYEAFENKESAPSTTPAEPVPTEASLS